MQPYTQNRSKLSTTRALRVTFMPATITPNKTEQDRKRRVEDHDNGAGRRPPTDKRTGGGGDNDNWNDRARGGRGPNERLHRYRMGIFFALASDLMFFIRSEEHTS